MSTLIPKHRIGSAFERKFAQARKAGKKYFYHNGQRYGTKLKNEVKQGIRKAKSTVKNAGRTVKNAANRVSNYVNNVTSSSNTQPSTQISVASYNGLQPATSDSRMPWLNYEQTYFIKPNNVGEEEMWGPGSQANPRPLPEITITATKPRESYDVKAHSQSNKLGKRYQGDKCAKWRNESLASMGYEIYGDAWTTSNFADKVYSGFEGLERPQRVSKKNLEEFNAQAARNFANNFSLDNLDPNEVYVVGTTYKGSPNKKVAFQEGTGGEANTHTGYAKFENGQWMFHSNVHGTEYISPMNQMLGDTATMAITSIYRPRPRKNKFGGLVSRKFKSGGYFQNGKVIKGQRGLVVVQDPDKVSSAQMDASARQIMAALMDQYDYYTKQGGVSPEEYEAIAKSLMGIAGNESTYGTGKRYLAKQFVPDVGYDLYHIAKGQPAITSRGVFQEKVGQDYIGESPETQVRYRNEYGRHGMNSLSQVPQQVASSPRRATQSALIKMVDDARKLRNMNLINKNGQNIPLTDALTFVWHYGMPTNWRKAEVLNDDYVTRARNNSNNFEYLR